MYEKALLYVLFLLVISPVFGVWLAELVGYHEPLDVAAEALGLKDLTDELNWTPFLDYTVPGLPAEIGYVLAGLIGIGIILGIGSLISKLLSRRRG